MPPINLCSWFDSFDRYPNELNYLIGFIKIWSALIFCKLCVHLRTNTRVMYRCTLTKMIDGSSKNAWVLSYTLFSISLYHLIIYEDVLTHSFWYSKSYFPNINKNMNTYVIRWIYKLLYQHFWMKSFSHQLVFSSNWKVFRSN